MIVRHHISARREVANISGANSNTSRHEMAELMGVEGECRSALTSQLSQIE
jgi:hypothetical protein